MEAYMGQLMKAVDAQTIVRLDDTVTTVRLYARHAHQGNLGTVQQAVRPAPMAASRITNNYLKLGAAQFTQQVPLAGTLVVWKLLISMGMVIWIL